MEEEEEEGASFPPPCGKVGELDRMGFDSISADSTKQGQVRRGGLQTCWWVNASKGARTQRAREMRLRPKRSSKRSIKTNLSPGGESKRKVKERFLT